jgi:hypothetical protein
MMPYAKLRTKAKQDRYFLVGYEVRKDFYGSDRNVEQHRKVAPLSARESRRIVRPLCNR